MSGKGAKGANGQGKPRRHPGILGKNPHLKAMRQRDAKERNEKWASKSLKEQLAELNQRFPDGAKKQKARIQAAIAKGPGPSPKTPAAKTEAEKNAKTG